MAMNTVANRHLEKTPPQFPKVEKVRGRVVTRPT